MTLAATQLADVEQARGPEILVDASVMRVIVGVDDSGPGLAALGRGGEAGHASWLKADRDACLGTGLATTRRAQDALTVVIKTPGCDPALALVNLARLPGDVIVVGRDSRHLLRRLIHGSISQYCVRHARCPVLLVPESGRPRGKGHAAGRRRSSSP